MTCYDDTQLPARERPVFIVTTGRSGSTLLLRYLNCAENLVVWGEHAGVLQEFTRAYRRLTDAETIAFVDAARPWVADLLAKRAVVCPPDQMTIEWVNGFEPATIREVFRELIFALFTIGLPETTRWGFKEIHYGSREMDLLRSLFAAPRFLLLLRDPAAILKSKFYAFAKGDVAAMPPHVAETRAFFQSAVAEHAKGAADVLFVRYVDLITEPEPEIARISSFIGAPFAPDAVRAIAGEREGLAESRPAQSEDLAALAAELGLASCADDFNAIADLDRRLTEEVFAGISPPASALAA
jgi:hypothetical protein